MSLIVAVENVFKPFPFLSAVASALLVALVVWLVTFIRGKTKSSSMGSIDIEYWRLFGPSVTRVMELLDSNPAGAVNDNYLSHIQVQLAVGEDIVEKDFWRAYCSIVNRRRFITCRRLLWEKYSGNKGEGRRIDFLAKPSTDYEINAWIEDNYIDQSGDIDREYVDTSDRNFGWQPAENDVGFLFMNLKNSSEISLRNVQIKFRKASLASQLPTIETPYRWPYKKIKAQFQAKGHPDTYLITGPIEFGETVVFNIQKWEPGLEIAFLLCIYRSDGDGFENGYLDDVYELHSIQSKKFLRTLSWPTRKPMREGSIREKIPYGWFRQ